MLYCISSNTVNINWSIQSTLSNQSTPPISQVTVEAYDNGEAITGTFPASLMHQTSIGNAVQTNVTATNSISNTTNSPLSTWLTVTPTDAASPTFSGDNSGNLTIKGDNAGVLTTLLKLIGGASPSASLPTLLGDLPGGAGYTNRFGIGLNGSTDTGFESTTYATVEGQSGVLIKQNAYYDGSTHRFVTANPAYMWDFGGSISGTVGSIAMRTNTNTPGAGASITWGAWQFVIPSLTSDGGKLTSDGAGDLTAVQYNGPAASNAILNATSGNTVQLSINGVSQATITTGNVHIDGHGLVCANVQPTAGQLNRIKFGHVAAISNQTVTHGLGATPSAVFISTDINQAGSATVGAGSVGSTTFVATVGAGNGFWWLALG